MCLRAVSGGIPVVEAAAVVKFINNKDTATHKIDLKRFTMQK
jgi:hypothetical protein